VRIAITEAGGRPGGKEKGGRSPGIRERGEREGGDGYYSFVSRFSPRVPRYLLLVDPDSAYFPRIMKEP
jgi:hypothetical protein